MKRERGGIVEGEGGEAKGVGKANEEEMREGRRAKDREGGKAMEGERREGGGRDEGGKAKK